MTTTKQLRDQMKTRTIPEQYVDSYKLFLGDAFERSPNFYNVNKNMSYSTNYKVIITDYDTDKNLIGWKRMIVYPYDTQVFDVGDYVNWTYNGVLTDWLIFAIDKQFDYNVRSKIKKCNNTLKWKDDDDNTISYPCVIDDKINNSDLDFNKHIIVPQGGIIVYVQKNTNTDTLSINDRFIFGGQAWKINSLVNYSSSTFVTLIMQYDNLDEDDDLVNNIANNTANSYVLTIDQDDFSQNISYSSTLTSTITLNDEIVSENVTWSSSDDSIATVNNSGVVTLLATGSVVITCSMQDNTTVNDSITITVTAVLPSDSDTIVSPNNNTILQGYTETYTVYRYIDNVVQADTFTIAASGVSSDYYTLTIIDGNSFSVENIKNYPDNNLVVALTNDVTSQVTNYEILLKGFW